MSIDIVPELLEKIKSSYIKGIKSSKLLASVKKKIKEGTATYDDIYAYSDEAADILAKAFKENVSGYELPNGIMYYNIAKRIVEPMFTALHEEIAQTAAEFQQMLNIQAGIGLKAIKPKLQQQKVEGIIKSLANGEEYDGYS